MNTTCPKCKSSDITVSTTNPSTEAERAHAAATGQKMHMSIFCKHCGEQTELGLLVPGGEPTATHLTLS